MAIINPNYGGTSGGVTSFNGRDGDVTPQEGDYTAAIQAAVGEVYSTEETVIGTWIDGRPLYQKTFIVSHSLSSSALSTSTLIQDSNIKLVQGYGVFELADLDNIYNIPYTLANQYLSVRQNGDVVQLVSYFNMKSYGTATVTLKYTKTTDPATIELPAALSETVAEDITKE